MSTATAPGPVVAIESNHTPSRARRHLEAWLGGCGLGLLALVLILLVYFRPLLQGDWRKVGVEGDAWFYTYQLSRVSELGGRWWLLGSDERIGAPYPSGAAKHPGLYEGLDLLLLGSVTGRYLPPEVNFHVLVVALLLFNAVIAGGLVRRLTGSLLWSVLAVALITVNSSTAMRIGSAPHLLKYGWALLTVWAFWRYLQAPTARRGVWLGLAAAWTLACSFYFGYLLGVVLTTWWIGCLLGGRLRRGHAVPTLAAGLTFGSVAFALTFPVWIISRHTLLADGNYFQHQRAELWWYGSELWQYFVSPVSHYGQELQQARGSDSVDGWHYPGLTVLLAIGGYLLARMRGWQLRTRSIPFLHYLLGIGGLLVLLSLTGGPSGVLYDLVKSFRCYGRCGQIAIGLWAVAAPLALHSLARLIPWRRASLLLCASVLVTVQYDARQVAAGYGRPPVAVPPPWSAWLTEQGPEVRLAAFQVLHGDFNVFWHWANLHQRLLHGHTVLNGGELALLQGDLHLLGASYESMNPDGLRFVATLGYNTLAFQEDYLQLHPWIATLPWLDPIAVRDGWHIYRGNERTPRFPVVSATELVAGVPQPSAPIRVPRCALITEQLVVREPVVSVSSETLALAWADSNGKLLCKPLPALYQHVFAPDQPAYSIVTPTRAGLYHLVFLDGQGRRLASRPYEVVEEMETLYRAQPSRSPLVYCVSTMSISGSGQVHFMLTNRTAFYVQSRVDTGHLSPSTLGQPALREPALGDVVLLLRPANSGSGPSDRQLILPLPADVPPFGQIRVEVTRERLVQVFGDKPMTVSATLFPGQPASAEGDKAELDVGCLK